jgi:glycine cleavage system aminomethyltransferase T
VGHANRSLRGLVAKAGEVLEPGLILLPEDGSTRESGQITRAAYHFGLDRWIALAYVRRGWDQPGTRLLAADAAGAKRAGVEVHAFPLYTP